jgi:hypothetical protein
VDFTRVSQRKFPLKISRVKYTKLAKIRSRPFNCMETFTPCIFLAYFGDVFFLIFSTEFQWPKFEVGF